MVLSTPKAWAKRLLDGDATRDAPALADALRARGVGQAHLLAALREPG